jgi:hypothetical protein
MSAVVTFKVGRTMNVEESQNLVRPKGCAAIALYSDTGGLSGGGNKDGLKLPGNSHECYDSSSSRNKEMTMSTSICVSSGLVAAIQSLDDDKNSNCSKLRASTTFYCKGSITPTVSSTSSAPALINIGTRCSSRSSTARPANCKRPSLDDRHQ